MTRLSDGQAVALGAQLLGLILCLLSGNGLVGGAGVAVTGALVAARYGAARRRPAHQVKILSARFERMLRATPVAVGVALISSAALNVPPAPTWLLMSSMILIIALPVTLVRAGWTREAA